MSRLLNFLAGLLMGAIVGATVAALLAPSSGEDLQNQLRTRADTIRSEVQKAAEQRRRELEDQLAHLRATS